MEVLCERCQTEYDFDDALVSERGTTVKCTNCGHQFRIFRPRPATAPPERWEVRTRGGLDFVFVSLRELQRAIARGQVGRDDILIRDGLSPRALSSIAELEPFFPSTVNHRPASASLPQAPSDAVSMPTRLGIGEGGFVAEPGPAPRPVSVPTPAGHSVSAVGSDLGPPTGSSTSPGLPPPAGREAKGAEVLGEEPPFEPETVRKPVTDHVPVRQLPPVAQLPPLPQPPPARVESVQAPQHVEIHQRQEPILTPTPSDVRSSYHSTLEEPISAKDSRPAHAAPPLLRWLVVVVLLGGVAVAAAAFGRKYIHSTRGTVPQSASVDPRVVEYLRTGERLLLDGDLEGAKESFDKASALAERDARVQVQLARWMNVRADLFWLKQRLLQADRTDALAMTKRELQEQAKRALQASQVAFDTAADDLAVVRVRVDAFRLSSDLASARRMAAKLTPHSAEPEVAYVLAALDMSEPAPSWTTVIDRLRVAVAGEQNLGRARGALIYALGSAGQADAAREELKVLLNAPRPFPLLLEIKEFVARLADTDKDSGTARLTDAAIEAATGMVLPGTGAAETADMAPGSYQDVLRRAHAARESGKWDQAEQLYRSVVARNPNDTEALSGLGDVARARGDSKGSASYYEQVRKNNPSYLPALIGLADAKWEAGDKAAAAAIYKQVLSETAGQGAYADRARQRIAGAAAPSAQQPTQAPPPKPSATSAASSASPPPGVDTSDLPGWKP